MPRKMRRARQALTPEETRGVLERGQTGILTLYGEDGYPYPVPINFALIGTTIYMHSAVEGHKIDAIKANPKAAFCVIDADKVVPERYGTDYRSAIAFGTAELVEDEDEMLFALESLGAKYNPGDHEGLQREIDKDFARVAIIALRVDYSTGKQAMTFVKGRHQA